MGMNFFSSVNWEDKTVTHGSGAGTTATAAQVTANPNTNGVGSKTLQLSAITADIVAGDRIKIAGCKRPMVVATGAVVANAAAIVADLTLGQVILVDPITEIISASAAVTTALAGKEVSYKGAIFDSQSLGVAMPMLDAAEVGQSATVSDNGVSIRVVASYDRKYKKSSISMDCLIGGFALDPRRILLLGSHS